MDSQLLRKQATLEKKHWWFVARRIILDWVLVNLNLPADARILEAGCGTGGNLPMLAKHGEVFAFDVSETARQLAEEWKSATIVEGSLPDGIPFAGETFDLIVLLDVLEHIEDDSAALRALRARLRPGGRVLITVPALPALWSYHDERHQHFRRYRKADLAARVRDVGYQLTTISYFNTLLLPLIAGVRLIRGIGFGGRQDDLAIPSPWLNEMMQRVFSQERHLLGRVPFPVGVSLFAVAKVPEINLGDHRNIGGI
jgi:SAM-dependent methyltransferase